jgi:aspartate 1-decarboxylase
MRRQLLKSKIHRAPAAYDESEAQQQPRVVLVDGQNHVVRSQLRAES